MSEKDNLDELRDGLKEVDKLLLMSAKQAQLLKLELSGLNKFIDSKNYEILSRFISGTGAWRVMNKIKASIQTMSQFQTMSERADLRRVEQEKKMGDLIRQRNKAQEVADALRNTDDAKLKELAEHSNSLTIALEKQRLGDTNAVSKYIEQIGEAQKATTDMIALLKEDGGTSKFDLFGKGFNDNQDNITYSGKKGDIRFDALKNRSMSQRMKAYTKIAWADAKSPFKGIKQGKLSNFIKSVGQSAKEQLKFIGKVMVYLAIFAIGLTLLIKAFKMLQPTITKTLDEWGFVFSFVFDMIAQGLGMIYEGLADIFEGIMSGDIFKVLEGMSKIFIGTIVTALSVVFGLGIATIWVGMMMIWDAITTGGEQGANALGGITVLLGTVAMGIALFAGAAISWPLLIVGGLVAGLGLILPKVLGGIFGFSTGGIVNSSMQLVGERGPELVSLPRGSRVHSNADSKRMGGSGGNTINVHVNGRVGASDAEIRDIASKVAREINLRMSRTGSGVNNF